MKQIECDPMVKRWWCLQPLRRGMTRIIFLLLTIQILSSSAAAVSIGEVSPSFTLKNLSDENISLSDHAGKVVFINFWATWCIPCIKELPMLNELQKRRKDDIVILAINIDKKKSNVESFLKKFQFEIPILLDPQGKVVEYYGARAMPMSYVLDREGRVRFFHFGFDEKNDPHQWEAEINALSGGDL